MAVGETYWVANDDNSISCVRWAEPHWTTTFAGPHEMKATHVVALLRKAYLAGRADQAEIVRNALSYGKAHP